MANAKNSVPRGYQALMPYLRVRDAASAIRFYKKVLGATERYRLKMGGKVGHAELDVGGSVLMLSDEFPEVGALGPQSLKGTSVILNVYVDNVDRLVAKAVKAGAKVRRPATDQFYGDRTAQIEDPYGHVWSIQARIEKVNPKDMQKRLNALLKAHASAAIAKRATAASTKNAKRAAPARKSASTKTVTAKKAATSHKTAKSAKTKPAPRKATVASGKKSAGKKAVKRLAKG